MSKVRLVYTREEMFNFNKQTLLKRGIKIEDIAEIAYKQQSRYTPNIPKSLCLDSVEKILTYRDVFHYVQLAAEIDRLAEEKMFKGPIQDILYYDLGLFGIDETFGLDVSSLYGTIGQTNFGDIDVNKVGIVAQLNEDGKKEGVCHTFMDDIVGALAAAASTRVAQVLNEETAEEDDPNMERISIYDL